MVTDIMVKCKVKFMRNSLETRYDTIWIDYQKAFDSIQHSWIRKIMRDMYRINPLITKFCDAAMKQWATKVSFHTRAGPKTTDTPLTPRNIPRRLALFSLVLHESVPFNKKLNELKCGYQLEQNKQLSHQHYMDELKLFSKGEEEPKEMIKRVIEFQWWCWYEFWIG